MGEKTFLDELFEATKNGDTEKVKKMIDQSEEEERKTNKKLKKERREKWKY